MFNVVLTCHGQAYFLDSIEVGANTGDRIYQVVKQAKTNVESMGITVVGVVGDNHSAVQNALTRCVQHKDQPIPLHTS